MSTRSLLAGLVALACLLPACADESDPGSSDASRAPVSQGPSADGGGKEQEAAAACVAGDHRGCQIDGDIVGEQSCGGEGAAAAWGECAALPCEYGEHSGCQTPDGGDGLRECRGSSGWSECGRLTGECAPGDTRECGGPIAGMSAPCALEGGVWRFMTGACMTPLVVSFDGAAVQFTEARGDFDVLGAGVCAPTSWVAAATPWLALDRDGNGRIDDGAELFGSMTRLSGGGRARQGFEALAPLDSDGDGRVTPADASWSRLVLWRDADQDRVSQPGELRGLDAEGVVAIELDYRSGFRCEAGGCEGERSRVIWRDGSGAERRGAMIDVRLADR